MGDAYDAFVSYSHGADGALAPAVQRGLQRLARPLLSRRALRVFRDETGLSTSPHLWEAIAAALSVSEWFVLLASPGSAHSEWVSKEVATWLSTKPLDRLLVVVTDGEIAFDASGRVDRARTDCLPEVLLDVLDAEPRWLDLRWARSETQLDLRHGRFRAAMADLAAPMHGVAKDDLEGEDVRLQRRARRLAFGGATTVTMLSVVAVVAAVIAVGQRHEADIQRGRALAGQQEAETQRAEAERQKTAAEAAATAARARAVSARADTAGDLQPDLSLLLAAEAYRMDPSPETSGPLLAALTRVNGVEHFVPAMDGSVVASADGTVLYNRHEDGSLHVIDVARWTSEEIAPPNDRPGGAGGVALSLDGSVLAVGGATGFDLYRTADMQPLGTVVAPDGLFVYGLDRDGSHLAYEVVPEIPADPSVDPVGLPQPDLRVVDLSGGPANAVPVSGLPDDLSGRSGVFLEDGRLVVTGTGATGTPNLVVLTVDGAAASTVARVTSMSDGRPLPAGAPARIPGSKIVVLFDPTSMTTVDLETFEAVPWGGMYELGQDPTASVYPVAMTAAADGRTVAFSGPASCEARGGLMVCSRRVALYRVGADGRTLTTAGVQPDQRVGTTDADLFSHLPTFLGSDQLYYPEFGQIGGAILALDGTPPTAEVLDEQPFGSIGFELLDDRTAVMVDERGLVVAPVNDLGSPSEVAALEGQPMAFDLAGNGSTAALVMGETCPGQNVLCSYRLELYSLPDLEPLRSIPLDDGRRLHQSESYVPDVVSLRGDGSQVAVPVGDGTVPVFDTATGELAATYLVAKAVEVDQPATTPLGVDITLGGPLSLVWDAPLAPLAVVSADGSLVAAEALTDPAAVADSQGADRTGVLGFQYNDRPYVFADFDPSSATMFTASSTGEIVEIDGSTGQPTGSTYPAQRPGIRQILVVDGLGLVIGVAGRSVVFWQVDSRLAVGQPVVALVDHFEQTAQDSAFSAVLRRAGVDSVIVRPDDEADAIDVTLWSFDPDDWVTSACAIAGRSLTQDEWDLYLGGEYQPACS